MPPPRLTFQSQVPVSLSRGSHPVPLPMQVCFLAHPLCTPWPQPLSRVILHGCPTEPQPQPVHRGPAQEGLRKTARGQLHVPRGAPGLSCVLASGPPTPHTSHGPFHRGGTQVPGIHHADPSPHHPSLFPARPGGVLRCMDKETAQNGEGRELKPGRGLSARGSLGLEGLFWFRTMLRPVLTYWVQ